MKRSTLFAGVLVLTMALTILLAACGSDSQEESTAGKTEVNIFAAASLTAVMETFEADFEKQDPGVDIIVNADSSGALMTQIEEGAPCDVFFSAAQKQMDELQEKGLIEENTRQNVVNNKLVVITWDGSGTAAKDLKSIGKAKSLALAGGSVPVGKYTRQAMMNLGMLEKVDDPAAITTAEISKQLGGVEISEQGNVSKVLSAVEEGSCEVGTTYLSDTIGREEKIRILETVPYDVTGDIIYPVAQVKNPDASEAQAQAAKDFIEYITGDEAKELYSEYGFDPDVE